MIDQDASIADLTLGERRAIESSPPEKKVGVVIAIKAARARRAEQLAAVEAKGSRELRRRDDGTLEGVSYGTVVALQPRDREYWQKVKGDPQKEDRLLTAYERRTGALRDEIIAFLEGA